MNIFIRGKNKSREKFWKDMSIRHQLYLAYFFSGVIPVLVLSAISIVITYMMFSSYNQKLLQSYSERVSTTLFEITTQAYGASEKIAYDSTLWNILGNRYISDDAAKRAEEAYESEGFGSGEYSAIDSISIYTENPTIYSNDHYEYADETIRSSEWYQKASGRQAPFWYGLTRKDKYGNRYWNIAIIRQIPAIESDYGAVLVIKLSSSYLRTRLTEEEYDYVVSIDGMKISNSSDDDYIGMDYEKFFGNVGGEEEIYDGMLRLDGINYMVHTAVTEPYRTDSKINICVLNGSIYNRLYEMSFRNFLLIFAALFIPFFIIRIFSGRLSGRITGLREAMRKVAVGEYDIPVDMTGTDEISETFSDLVNTARQMQEKNSRIYEVQLVEKDMRMKVLQSQMNPHFLYNTLETIRMKALTNGDREVSNVIKALGKILRFNLDNSRKSEVALGAELTIIESYLDIMKLRLGDRLTVKMNIDEDIDIEKTAVPPCMIQPLLENAIIHGLADKESGGVVTLGITSASGEEEDELCIRVTDNGSGIDEKTLAEIRERMARDDDTGRHIGLANINRRVKLGFGEGYGVKVDSEPYKGTLVEINIPFSTVKI